MRCRLSSAQVRSGALRSRAHQRGSAASLRGFVFEDLPDGDRVLLGPLSATRVYLPDGYRVHSPRLKVPFEPSPHACSPHSSAPPVRQRTDQDDFSRLRKFLFAVQNTVPFSRGMSQAPRARDSVRAGQGYRPGSPHCARA